jgi:hypothetical protein
VVQAERACKPHESPTGKGHAKAGVMLDPDILPCQISIMRMVRVMGLMVMVCAGIVPAPGLAGGACTVGCDDADPCTTDVCEGSSCRHDGLPRAQALDCACQAIGRTACTDTPGGVRRPHESACRLLASSNGGSTSPRRLTRARRRTELAWNRAERAAAKGRLSADCRDAVRRQLEHLFDAMTEPAP